MIIKNKYIELDIDTEDDNFSVGIYTPRNNKCLFMSKFELTELYNMLDMMFEENYEACKLICND